MKIQRKVQYSLYYFIYNSLLFIFHLDYVQNYSNCYSTSFRFIQVISKYFYIDKSYYSDLFNYFYLCFRLGFSPANRTTLQTTAAMSQVTILQLSIIQMIIKYIFVRLLVFLLGFLQNYSTN